MRRCCASLGLIAERATMPRFDLRVGMAKSSGSNVVVYAALAGNLGVAIAKFVAAGLSGSSAMLSEGVHSLVDTTNEVLLLYGMHRAKLKPDRTHPFGHGRELYFWSFIVALLVFSLGAGVSFYEGLTHILHPVASKDPLLNYIVLGISALFEGSSWLLALREFRAAKGRMGYFEAFRKSKDPTTFTVLLEDSAALLGLLIAATGLALEQTLGMPVFDGIASIGISLVLAISATALARESKGLLIGEPADPVVSQSILKIADADEGVRHANGANTMQMGPNQVVATLSAEFEDVLHTTDIEVCIRRIESAAKAAHPEVTALFVKPQTAEAWRAEREAIDQRGPEG